MTEPGKNALGLTGFPTPDEAADTSAYLLFLFNDPTFAQWLLGALETLVYEYNWYKSGDLEPEEASELFRLIVQQAPYNLLPLTAPIPYWDESSGDDADDEMSRDTQPWYGEIVTSMSFVAEDAELTFLDNLGIWLIAGFIAYSGQVAAAIAFVPLARKFVLAFKQHSLGGVVSVLVDFLHLADIDTYGVEDGITNYTVSIPDDGEEHTLYVMMSDEHNPAVTDPPNIQVIRKRLDETEVTPDNIRWDADCDCVQQSPDNGSTWVDSPTQDPRKSTIFQVPARSGDDPRCDAAQQMHDRVKNMLDAIIASSDILQAINSVVALIAVFLFEVGWIIEAIWALVSAIFSIGTTTLSAALTDGVYDQLLCIFYCAIGSDGTVTEDQYNTIVSEVTDQIGGVAAVAINQILSGIGWVGLTNAGALGEVTGDCSGCDCLWCYTFDADNGWSGWTVEDAGIYTGGELSAGVWQSTLASDGTGTTQVLGIQVDIPGVVTQIKVFWSAVGNENGAGRSIATLPDNTVIQVIPDFTGTNITTWDGTLTDPTIAIRVDSIASGCCNYITKVIMHGTGDNPFGENNC